MHQINDYELKEYIESGKSPESYAETTGFSINTIRKHLISMAENETLDITKLIPEEEIRMMVNILVHVEWDCHISSLYKIMEGRYSYFILRLLFHSGFFLSMLKSASEQTKVMWDTHYLDHIVYANKNCKGNAYMHMPGTYVYFLFGTPENGNDSGLLFIDITKNLGKVVKDSEKTAEKIGYIRVGTEGEGRALAKYYTAGMNPKYPSYETDGNVIVKIDEKKMKPGMIRLRKSGQ